MKPSLLRQWTYHNPRMALAVIVAMTMIFDNEWLSPYKEN